jgi:hypothetical protein
MGGGGGGSQVIPFNMSALEPFMPSIFQGPYNAQGAYANEQMIANKYPWITPPAGQFEGAQPGQFAGASNPNSAPGFFGGGGIPGVGTVPPPSPPIPPSAPGAPPMPATQNPQALATGAPNGMQPNSLQQILSVLMAGQPAAAPAGA